MYAFLSSEQLPDQEKLQAAIFELGFDLELDPMYNVQKTSGHVSCVLDGQLSGCEIYASNQRPEAAKEPAEFAFVPDTHTSCISLSCDDDMLESIVVTILAATLAKRFDAIVSHNGDQPMSAAELVAGAELMLTVLD